MAWLSELVRVDRTAPPTLRLRPEDAQAVFHTISGRFHLHKAQGVGELK
jgi:hypothetical protein